MCGRGGRFCVRRLKRLFLHRTRQLQSSLLLPSPPTPPSPPPPSLIHKVPAGIAVLILTTTATLNGGTVRRAGEDNPSSYTPTSPNSSSVPSERSNKKKKHAVRSGEAKNLATEKKKTHTHTHMDVKHTHTRLFTRRPTGQQTRLRLAPSPPAPPY